MIRSYEDIRSPRVKLTMFTALLGAWAQIYERLYNCLQWQEKETPFSVFIVRRIIVEIGLKAFYFLFNLLNNLLKLISKHWDAYDVWGQKCATSGTMMRTFRSNDADIRERWCGHLIKEWWYGHSGAMRQTFWNDDADIKEQWCGYSGTMMRTFGNDDVDIHEQWYENSGAMMH